MFWKQKKRRHDGRRKLAEKRNTEDGVILRGRGCNVPLTHLVIYVTKCIVLVSGRGAQGQGPTGNNSCNLCK